MSGEGLPPGRPGFAPGHPHYFRDPVVDHLLEIVLKLGAELWVLRDRHEIVEHLLGAGGSVTRERIESFTPPPELAARLQADRAAFLERTFGCLYESLPGSDRQTFVAGILGEKTAGSRGAG